MAPLTFPPLRLRDACLRHCLIIALRPCLLYCPPLLAITRAITAATLLVTFRSSYYAEPPYH